MQGFAVALQPMNLLWCFVGVVLGTVVGVMPGLGPPATIAMLLPLTFLMNPASAMIMLAGIYYGAKYGGSTTSILLNVPGESASVVTCIDGYQMARKGRAGAALGIAAIASFIAGTVGVLGLMLIAPPLARLSLAFSSPEYFALMALGLAMVVLLAGELDGQGAARHAGRPVARRHRHRPLQPDLALHLRPHGAARRASTSWWWRSACSPSARCSPTCSERGGAPAIAVPKGLRNLLPTHAGPEGLALRLRQRLGGRLLHRRAAGRRARPSPRSSPTAWRRRCRATRRNSARAWSRASPRPRARTTPRPAAR